MEDDEFNDFEEAQPPTTTNPPEQLEAGLDIGWNIGNEGTSMGIQNEGGDIDSTL